MSADFPESIPCVHWPQRAVRFSVGFNAGCLAVVLDAVMAAVFDVVLAAASAALLVPVLDAVLSQCIFFESIIGCQHRMRYWIE